MFTSQAIQIILGVSCIVLSACGSQDSAEDVDEASGGASGESDSCCRLGAICHVADPDVSPEVKACHDLAHDNVQEVCDERYQECLEICEGVNDEPMEHSCD